MTDVSSFIRSDRIRSQMFELAMVAAILMMIVIFAVAEPQFLSLANVSNVLTQSSYLVLLACAQAVVILVRGFDLSLGGTVSLVSLTAAMGMTMTGALPIPAGIAAGVVTGLIVGLFNGFCVAWLKINPFIVTLATMNILLAISSTITGGFPVTDLPDGFSDMLSTAAPLGVPVPVIVTAVVVFLLHLMLRRTRFGRSMFLVGSNPEAAYVAGISSRRILLWSYALCSFLIALGAILMTARTGSGEPNLGGALTLQTIAAAVIGGMSLRGGEGSMAAPVLGGFFVTILSNGMNLTRVDGYLQEVTLGVLIVAVLVLDRLRHRRTS
ncbi:ABC transporter permease [Roseovarius sp. THAF27]|uniref:ABC transporter permease n=1 Tax=Roseovarius sp. THAF27 TaxID=2587850 RepID=UPI001C12C1FB|nr:ABC transporter permease [Roseovarius sp. THAF27]